MLSGNRIFTRIGILSSLDKLPLLRYFYQLRLKNSVCYQNPDNNLLVIFEELFTLRKKLTTKDKTLASAKAIHEISAENSNANVVSANLRDDLGFGWTIVKFLFRSPITTL